MISARTKALAKQREIIAFFGILLRTDINLSLKSQLPEIWVLCWQGKTKCLFCYSDLHKSLCPASTSKGPTSCQKAAFGLQAGVALPLPRKLLMGVMVSVLMDYTKKYWRGST